MRFQVACNPCMTVPDEYYDTLLAGCFFNKRISELGDHYFDSLPFITGVVSKIDAIDISEIRNNGDTVGRVVCEHPLFHNPSGINYYRWSTNADKARNPYIKRRNGNRSVIPYSVQTLSLLAAMTQHVKKLHAASARWIYPIFHLSLSVSVESRIAWYSLDFFLMIVSLPPIDK